MRKKYYCKVLDCNKEICHGTFLYGKGCCGSHGQKGKILSKKHKIKIKKSMEGVKNHFYGKRHDKNSKSKMSLSHGGTGIPGELSEYGEKFDNDLREQVRFRDNYKCQVCGCSQLENKKQLDVHHIDYNKKNNNINNLIALCRRCHMKTNINREYWRKYFYDNSSAIKSN